MVAMARLFRRRKQGWWHEPAGWTLGIALTFPGGMLAVPVSQYAQALALPAELTGIAIALAATVGFFVVKRHSWLLAAPLSFGLSFSLFLALTEGWNAQLNLVLSVGKFAVMLGAIGLAVVAVVISGREFRRLDHASKDITREIGETVASEGLFRDDGERIIIYAHPGRVVVHALTTVAVQALFGAGGLWVLIVVPTGFWQIVIVACLGLFLCVGGVSALLMLIRAVMTGPTLVVSADGILDNCSMIVTGRGLLLWNETLGVDEFVYTPNAAMTYRFLEIDVTDPRAINRRQPLWKRMLAFVVSLRQPMGFRIPRPLLDRTPTALVKEIDRYIHTHSPAGSWHQAVTGADAEAEQQDEA